MPDEVKRFGELDPIVLDPFFFQHLMQIVSPDELHYDVDPGMVPTAVVNLDDAGMVQLGAALGFSQEPLLKIGFLGVEGMHDLDGHVSA